MAYVVSNNCIKCKNTDCAAVCPVDCFYEGKNMLVIHPDECIDCGACEAECPETAIFDARDLPAKWLVYRSINAVFSGARRFSEIPTAEQKLWPAALVAGEQVWPWITDQKEPLPGAYNAPDDPDKLKYLDPNGQE